jgi:peroxiredoxin
MHFAKNRTSLTIGLLVSIILLLIVQNFFLVRKSNDRLREIEGLREQLNSISLMNVGDSISSFGVLDLDTSLVTIVQKNDNGPRLLLVFTTWCHFCQENMEQWNQLLQETGWNARVIGLSPDPVHVIKEYITRVRVSFPVYSVSNDSSIMTRYRLKSFPQTIFD